MPRLPVAADQAKHIAAFLLQYSRPAHESEPAITPPSNAQIQIVVRRLRVSGPKDAAVALLRQKRCAACHPGLDQETAADVPMKATRNATGCLSNKTLPRFALDDKTRTALAAYQAIAAREKHSSPFTDRQRLVERLGCVRCHQRDSDRPPPLEVAGSTLGGGFLVSIPFQRGPRLTYPHQKFTRAHLLAAVRDGTSGLRSSHYSYRMPAFGPDAADAVRALAEADGELPDAADLPDPPPADRTLGPLAGPGLVGFQGYACVSCHLWSGKALSEPDPAAVGTELTRVVGRIRRDWFDRYLEGPARFHPSTPMPAIFMKGKPALLTSILGGDPARQKDALWGYFALAKDAPSPKPPPPLPVEAPGPGEPPLVAQIPVRLPDNTLIESVCLLYGTHDLFVWDLGAMTLHAGYTGGQILRGVQGRLRNFSIAGTPLGTGFRADPPLQLTGPGKPELPMTRTLRGYDRLPDGVRIRWHAVFAPGGTEVAETLRLTTDGGERRLVRELQFAGIPPLHALTFRARTPGAVDLAATGNAKSNVTTDGIHTVLTPAGGQCTLTIRHHLPAAKTPPPFERASFPDPGPITGPLERPGYRAIPYPRPKTVSGEDRVMPSALAFDPKDGRVFIASMKTGELFVLRDPTDDGRSARFENYARGLFQEAFSMLAEPGALYVLHRRNLTRITENNGNGPANRFERVAALPHGIADTYDYGYGLARDRAGAFVYGFAPYANGQIPGSGAAVRHVPGREPREVAAGFRNPLGWCRGPDSEIFITDNQGDWVATNKLCHLVDGRFYGYPNPRRPKYVGQPTGKAAVWVPYGWAKSINGVTCDETGGKFGPFAGQLFMAELMFGGAIVRASLEKVNGEYQGACFPFWGKGLLGPLTLAFDPRGRLWVGGITEPGWMAQPDRGALFRIDHTGRTPFEMQTIRVLPRGFRIRFTAPVAPATARDPRSYEVEHYRYEYTGGYGSPELDRTRVAIARIEPSADGRGVDLIVSPLVTNRVYMIRAQGVRSATGETLVHPEGAYTLNEVPRGSGAGNAAQGE
jgi:glucose/arabinose dehydrogenase